MDFTENELDMIYQYAMDSKEETIKGVKEIIPYIKDSSVKEIVQSTITKLENMPEPECSKFIADTKANFIAKRDKSIRKRTAKARIT